MNCTHYVFSFSGHRDFVFNNLCRSVKSCSERDFMADTSSENWRGDSGRMSKWEEAQISLKSFSTSVLATLESFATAWSKTSTSLLIIPAEERNGNCNHKARELLLCIFYNCYFFFSIISKAGNISSLQWYLVPSQHLDYQN